MVEWPYEFPTYSYQNLTLWKELDFSCGPLTPGG